MTSTRTRLAAAAGALALTTLAAAPAGAATVLSRAEANAATVSIAGNDQGTGTAGATYDGDTETRTGQTQPTSPFPQQFVDLGVLTQQATAGDGFSAACAGVAGNGGGVVQIGDGSCLTPGDTVTGSLSDISLAGLGLEPPAQLPLPAELTPLLEAVSGGRAQLDAILAQALGSVDEAVGPLGLALRFDAIEGRCRVEGGSPSGSASIANASLVLSGGGRQLQVVDLPADPGPNTEVTTDLSQVVALVLDAATTQLRNGLDGATGPLATAIAPFRDQIVAGVRDNLDGQLAPLRDAVLSVVLNEQRNPTADSIEVTALHASVLPAAASAVGASLADVRIGNADCGPAGSAPQVEAPAAAPKPQGVPKIPTAVSAGVESAPHAQQAQTVSWQGLAPLALTGLVGLVVAGLGIAGLRRHLS
ncbi:hypothetical protein SAMN04488570_1488 [Nocardioides scoriae]|uniref:Choice-of-anchor G family protein n=1 Tax=Nocardioides scoriae TaxID=642780 RepID=A0A1H1QSC2_9ACTN|nr:hypothetical protein [Nocardioides scoriae]SDS26213.1 hypothetical protein SAMN04488570_1488 [Nocardioides scoriae]